MKLIIAIVQPSRLEAVKEALTEVEVFRLTVMDCQGFGRQKGQTEVYRGHEFTVNLLRKVQLQIAVNEDFVEPTIDAIIRGGRTGEKGQIGDGKIFVLPLEDCVRIRTGERGGDAISRVFRSESEDSRSNAPEVLRNDYEYFSPAELVDQVHLERPWRCTQRTYSRTMRDFTAGRCEVTHITCHPHHSAPNDAQ